MDFLSHNIHKVLDRSLQGLQREQKNIQQNLSNLDTPGYKRKDFQFDKFMKNEIENRNQKDNFELKRTHKNHLSFDETKEKENINSFSFFDKDPTLWTDNTGNNVSLDKENVEMSKNQLHSNTVINLYKKYSNVQKNTLATLSK